MKISNLRTRPSQTRALGATATIVVGVGLSFIIPAFTAHTVSLWVIYGLLALSFTFVWGHGGIFSLGQAAFFGLGGYAYGVAGIDLAPTTHETMSALLVAAVVGAGSAALLGYFVIYGGIRGVFVAVITIAATLALLTFFTSTGDPAYHIGAAMLGGDNGMVGVPSLTLPGLLSTSNGTLATVVVVAVIVWFAIAELLHRPFGRILAGTRENEFRTQLLGYDVRGRTLAAFVVGGLIAGLAGGLYAGWGNFISPQVFSLQQASLVAIWALVGGRRSLIGAFIGAFAVQGLSELLGQLTSGAVIPLVLGIILLLLVLFLPNGVLPTIVASVLGLVRQKGTVQPSVQNYVEPDPDAAFGRAPSRGLKVTAKAVSMRFGGLSVLRGIDLEVPANAVRTLIGPNGAGKSTFFNLMIGRYRPTAGEIYLGDVRVTRLRPEKRARLGLGIKTQVPSIYSELTVAENVWIAAWAVSRRTQEASRMSAHVLAGLGLTHRAAELAGALSHGELQWLEIGMVIAREPRVVLLDEPTAGMTRAETRRYVDLVAVLARSATVIVVEHDMEFVRELEAQVTMFHDGTVFAEGLMDDLRHDDRILDVYLGRADSA